ncbi:MAG TPA: ABC transporter permease [Vicinamibacterales bacterium]|jgi:putative ABC transport system permease protein|nr:ABC transporter permease [Vicinamibacterales bacterium]
MLSQIIAVTGVNIRSIRARLGSSSVAIIGIAGVVLVFVAVLSIAEGVNATMKASGDPNVVLILRAGSDTEMTSGLGGDQTRIIQDAPGIARDASGAPITSPELFVVVDHPLKRSGSPANVPLRGVTPEAFKVHDHMKIVEGRNLQFGKNEIIAGRAATRQFVDLTVGRTLKWGENTWTLVGIFEDGGSVSESELWCDVRVLQPAYRRGNSYQSVYARLAAPDAFTQLKDSLTSNPQLQVSAMRAPDYYGGQTQTLQNIIRTIGGIIAILMGVGAVFGAVITMYTAVASRTREIATLRALGFGSIPVVVSVLVEASFLALVGGVIGGAIAWAAFNGYETATMNFQSFSQIAFKFAVTGRLLANALFYALLMGLMGGLLPAIRAARLPVVTALREL